jgi:anti-sigma factor RsiW
MLGRLPGQRQGNDEDPEVQRIEEHLLVCSACVPKAESIEREIAVLRAALASFASEFCARKRMKVAGSTM